MRKCLVWAKSDFWYDGDRILLEEPIGEIRKVRFLHFSKGLPYEIWYNEDQCDDWYNVILSDWIRSVAVSWATVRKMFDFVEDRRDSRISEILG